MNPILIRTEDGKLLNASRFDQIDIFEDWNRNGASSWRKIEARKGVGDQAERVVIRSFKWDNLGEAIRIFDDLCTDIDKILMDQAKGIIDVREMF